MAGKWSWVYRDPRWNPLRQRVFEEETDCWFGDGYVDQRLPARHPMSKTVHHIRDLNLGGAPFDRDNVALAHYTCNASAGAKQGNVTRAARRTPSPAVIRGMRVHVQATDL